MQYAAKLMPLSHSRRFYLHFIMGQESVSRYHLQLSTINFRMNGGERGGRIFSVRSGSRSQFKTRLLACISDMWFEVYAIVIAPKVQNDL